MAVNKKQAYTGLLFLLLITAGFAYQIRHLQFNDNFDLFFPEGDEDLEYYIDITEEFGVFNNFLFIALKDSNVYESSFLKKLDKLTETLEELPESTSVISATNYERYQITPFGLNRFNVINPNKDLQKSEIQQNDQLYGQYFGKDDESAGLILRHIAFSNKKEADQFYLDLLDVLDDQGFEDPIISGKIQAQYDFTIRLQGELGLLLGASVLLVVIMLAIVFRTVRGVIIPLITLLTTLIWMFGFFALTGKQIDVLAIMIPPILLVVSMSDVIHLCNKFNDSFNRGVGLIESLKICFKYVGLATLLTSVTTAVGFFSLMVSPISPIKDFGLYTGIGIIFAFLVTFTAIPCLLIILGKGLNPRTSSQSFWTKPLGNSFVWVLRNSKWIVSLSILLLIIGGVGSTYVKRNTFLIVGVAQDDPLMESMQYFDQYYDGNKPFELAIELPAEENLFNEATLSKLEQVHQYLNREYGISHIESPLTIIKAINQAMNGGATSEYKIPSSKDFSRIKRLYNSSQFSEVRSKLHSEDGVTLRLNGRGRDIGSAQAAVKNDEFRQFMREQIGSEVFDYRITGTSYLIDKTDDYIVKSILTGLVLAIAAVALLMLIISKSWKVMLISILPNVLPLIILGGIMGFSGVDLNIATAVIFSIAFGIAVDDSIHFITRYQLEYKQLGNIMAIRRTFLSTGKSIILTTTVLFVGFIVFLFSGFSATYYIGLFVGITFIVALIADLTLLPVLLSIRKKSS